MKRTFVFLGLSIVLAIATLAQGTSFGTSRAAQSCCHQKTSQSFCQSGCTDKHCQNK